MATKYQRHVSEFGAESVIRVEDQAWIPRDLTNVDYQDYLKWLEEGNEPEPHEAPFPYPNAPKTV